jgi:large subunit ribosomal protein L11
MAFIDKDNLTIVTRKNPSMKTVNKKVATVKMYVPATEAKPGAPIAPILGQHQINAIEFCKRFNELSAIYESGVPLPTTIIKMSDGKFEIKVEFPIFVFLLWLIMEEQIKSRVTVADLYNLVNLYSLGTSKEIQKVSKDVFGFLSSTHIRKIIV